MSESTEPWPLLDSGGTAPEPATGGRCPVCTYPVSPWASFCEGCGAPLLPTEAPPLATPSEGSAQTRRLGVVAAAPACPECGGVIGPDGYCLTCGAKAPNPGDHLEAAPADWVGGVCDRGLSHPRNEDAMALWAGNEPGTAVLVVCDGVSTSDEADVASRAGVERACAVLVAAVEAGGEPGAMEPVLVNAAAEANAAIVDATSAESDNAASATFAAAVASDGTIHYAGLGDSRVYWVSDTEQLQLTADDSVSQAFIEQGMSRQEAESMPSAHAITKWLGRDADSVVPRTGSYRPTSDGWLVVCSDGLWNYASEPRALAAQVTAAAADGVPPVVVARRLVSWANSQGGHDNVTVALARLTTSPAERQRGESSVG